MDNHDIHEDEAASRSLNLPVGRLDETRRLLARELQACEPYDILINVLEAAIELVSMEGNDFNWSSWHDGDDAVAEIGSLLNRVKGGDLPERNRLAVLFAPTGPMQEVALTSGWGQTFLEVARCYDYAEKRLWK